MPVLIVGNASTITNTRLPRRRLNATNNQSAHRRDADARPPAAQRLERLGTGGLDGHVLGRRPLPPPQGYGDRYLVGFGIAERTARLAYRIAGGPSAQWHRRPRIRNVRGRRHRSLHSLLHSFHDASTPPDA